MSLQQALYLAMGASHCVWPAVGPSTNPRYVAAFSMRKFVHSGKCLRSQFRISETIGSVMMVELTMMTHFSGLRSRPAQSFATKSFSQIFQVPEVTKAAADIVGTCSNDALSRCSKVIIELLQDGIETTIKNECGCRATLKNARKIPI